MAGLGLLVLTNALLATGLAALVWTLSRWVRRPALLHSLWLLVLLRLAAPPLLILHLAGWGAWLTDTVPRQTSERTLTAIRYAAREQTRWVAMIQDAFSREDFLPRRELGTSRGRVSAERFGERPGLAATIGAATKARSWLRDRWAWVLTRAQRLLTIATLAWLAGAAACGAVQWYLGLRFRWWLRSRAYSSRLWQRRADRLARRLQLRSCPQVQLVRGAISPMLWGFGRGARLLFPERLLEQLDAESQDALLAHELAHHRRGDQWVRLIELLITPFFWWHPVLWWARREIEAAEESCCDAWALLQSGGRPKKYAEALLAAVDLMHLPILPPAASGVGVRLLRQRLATIMQGTTAPPTLRPRTRAAVGLLAAAALLPCPVVWTDVGVAVGTSSGAPRTTLAVAEQITTSSDVDDQLKSAPAPRGYRAKHATIHARSPDGRFVLEIDQSQRARLYQTSALANDDPARRAPALDLGVGRIAAADFSGDGRLLALGLLDGSLDVIECATGRRVWRRSGAKAAVISVAFSPSGEDLAMGTRDGACRVISLTDDGFRLVERRPGQTVRCVRYSPDGSSLAVVWNLGIDASQIDVWDTATGRRTGGVQTRHRVAAILPDATAPRWLVVNHDGASRVWSGDQGWSPLARATPIQLLPWLTFSPANTATLAERLDHELAELNSE